jgi:hypothetical protein
MHPIILAYLQWRKLYGLVVFGGRDDLSDERRRAWEFFLEMRGD